ncbi:uncharacterized protein LOC119996284 [Tripterygium wilfordii]|uniref:uncharacterized protein LOC119996284 n=1 Tax=Tripterygium wilfordii TaxID=458696 RepID=UPI0018F80214|nr:uncharacterized protein LOC119996284 [Tripterygium wilfordii]
MPCFRRRVVLLISNPAEFIEETQDTVSHGILVSSLSLQFFKLVVRLKFVREPYFKLLVYNFVILVFILTDTRLKFATCDTIVEVIYKHTISTPKNQCRKTRSCCCFADNLVSFPNNVKGATVVD